MYISFLSLVNTTFYFRAQTFVGRLSNVCDYVNSSTHMLCVFEDTERREGEQMNKGRNKGQRAEVIQPDSRTDGHPDS